ncbi:MAG: peptidylprolyl isomerase [Patescibacteria group bacterium]|jgi:peptidylprolyl isomerase
MKNKYLLIALIICSVALTGCGIQKDEVKEAVPAGSVAVIGRTVTESPASPADASSSQATSSATIINKTLTMPEIIIDQSKTYTAVLHTDRGDITVALNAKATPITVNNFVYLAKNNFYDNTIFHRVIKDFMIQGGDPKGDGTGGPGYKFADEKFTGEYARGTLAMANSGPNTNGSQFFIMHADVPLQKDYVIFGRVTKGLDVVDKIATAATTLGADGAMSKPVTPVKVNSIEIIEK